MATEAQKKKAKRAVKPPTLLRGFKDILPEDAACWRLVRDAAERILDDYGYREITVPVLEQTNLFKRGIGEHTDIVSKEMFTFTDRGNDSVTMRPELTAGIVRAYIEHGMLNRPQPIKLYSFGPVFRYDRPQAGRFRQFHQLSIELIGSPDPVSDAEVIFISNLICKELKLDVRFQVNSIGDSESRIEYTSLLKEYYRAKRRLLCEDCKKRLMKNTLRLLDCKESSCRELLTNAPQLVDHIDEASKQHFVSVLEHLGESEVPYELNPYIVRGLDYYNRTTFEIVPDQEQEAEPEAGARAKADALGGGGRYDGLVELLGGRETPALGMAFGLERMVDMLKRCNRGGTKPKEVQVYLAQLGEEAAKHIFSLFERLRRAGIRVRANFGKEGLKAQLEQANKLNVMYTMILGQKELLDETIIIRDMENGIQEVVDLHKAEEEIKKRLKK